MNDLVNPTGLSYCLPKEDKVHTVLHIPGSHTLFIGPSACTRRHAMHATAYGDRKDVSFLYITEADMVSGDYENIVKDAIADLLVMLTPVPHIFILSVFCIDDFLGTDEEALVNSLSGQFPGYDFAVQHIDPVSLEQDPKKNSLRRHFNKYCFLKEAKAHDRGVNMLGNYASLDPECELFSLFESWGIGPVRELVQCKTYEDYQDMAKSRFALGLRHTWPGTIEYMEKTLKIPYFYFPTSYDVEFISKGYEKIARLSGAPTPDITKEASKTLQDACQTARLIEGVPLALDSSAFLMPFSAALALIEYGFEVRYIFRGGHVFKGELEALEKIKQMPDVKVFWKDDFSNFKSLEGDADCLAIGADCRRLLHARRFVDIWHDEGYFGFHGIHRLMAAIRESMEV